jgi:hypothetical protein
MGATGTALHEVWLGQALGRAIPEERRATCGACAMCAGQADRASVPSFAPDTKCCTYWPRLPNYLCGAILSSGRVGHPEGGLDGESGSARVGHLLYSDCAVPLGIGAAEAYRALYMAVGRIEFGRSMTLVCPYYSSVAGGTCTIWPWREAVCSTYFCKFDRGAVGLGFWHAAANLLESIQRAVALWCAVRLNIPATGLHVAIPAAEARGAENARRQSLDGTGLPGRDSTLWGEWADKRDEFFVSCWELASTLPWSEVVRLTGIEGETLAEEMRRAMVSLQDVELPPALKAAPIRWADRNEHSILVCGYRDTDARWVKEGVLRALKHFDGRSIDEVLAKITECEGLVLSLDEIRGLVDLGVLVRAQPPEP